MTRSGAERSGRSDVGEISRAKSRLQSQQKQYDELKAVVAMLESADIQALFDKQQQLTVAEQMLRNEASQAGSRNDQMRRQLQRPAHYTVTVLDGMRD